MNKRITIRKPDDWHIHFRDGELLAPVVDASARHFARGIIMPNLVPPVTTVDSMSAYRQRIQDSLPEGSSFEPLMTLYLTDNTAPSEIQKAKTQGFIRAVKLYPAGATTNSDSGVTHIDNVMGVLEHMADLRIPLCIHGEVTDPDIDIFDREAVFIDTVLLPLRARLPELRIILEHVTTREGVSVIQDTQHNLAGTLTPHHLMINRNYLFKGGIRPHYYCLPIAKREEHRLVLRQAATSGDARFFLGTDSAPHVDAAKHAPCGCAGVFNSVNALSCLAHVFEEENALDNLEAFVSINGPTYYDMPLNEDTTTLERMETPVSYPKSVETPAGPVTVFDPEVDLYWRVVE